jgi:hypothetical protein
VGIHSTRCGTKEIKKRKYIKEKKVKKMIINIKHILLRDFNKVHTSLVDLYGKDKADEIMLHWLWELKDIIIRGRGV